ncbi:MAG: hypothetical protein IJX72_00245 [Clostridia bacterium]|nr:hypothetical protein [Clostridia bacterium]
MNHTPQTIVQALIGIAQDIVDEYNAQIKVLEPSAKTEKKALITQREMASLCNRAGLVGFAHPNYCADPRIPDSRFCVTTAHYPAVTAYYGALAEDDRRAVLPYLHSLYFMSINFLIPWRAEFSRAKDAGDAAAAFELGLKIHTVERVLDARRAWWQENAAELPAMPEEIRDGKELQPITENAFYAYAHEALHAESQRLEAQIRHFDQHPDEKKANMADYKCLRFRCASVDSICMMLYHGNRVYRRPAVHLDIENSLTARPDYLSICENAPADERIDYKLYYGISAHIESKLKEHEAGLVRATDWEAIELEERMGGLRFAKACLDEAWDKREV